MLKKRNKYKHSKPIFFYSCFACRNPCNYTATDYSNVLEMVQKLVYIQTVIGISTGLYFVSIY